MLSYLGLLIYEYSIIIYEDSTVQEKIYTAGYYYDVDYKFYGQERILL